MNIQKVQTTDRNINQLQQNIIVAVSPVLQNALVNGVILNGVAIKTTTTTINHTLGRTLIGWFMVRKRGLGDVYDQQDSNPTPSLNLLLISSVAVNVDIYVF